MVETNVHYPTDINLLFDAIRKVVTLTVALSILLSLTDWRQSKHNLKTIKRLFRKAQQLKRSTSKKPEKKEQREKLIVDAHQQYIDTVQEFLDKAHTTIDTIDMCALPVDVGFLKVSVKVMEIETYIQHAQRQIKPVDESLKMKKSRIMKKYFQFFKTIPSGLTKVKLAYLLSSV